jgi:hypothetical protein
MLSTRGQFTYINKIKRIYSQIGYTIDGIGKRYQVCAMDEENAMTEVERCGC